MIDLNEVEVTPRDQQVLQLLVQGCSKPEIAGQWKISPRTVKQHLRTLFLRADIGIAASESNCHGRIYTRAGQIMMPRERWSAKEV